MNPITQTKNQNAMNERELRLGYTGTESSWHRQYKDSAWIFIGGLDYDLTEGDIICVFSQYGEVANINLVRDKDTGRSKGFAFVCYENQKSTILATDNLNGIKIAGRIIRVDHVEKYKVPTVGLTRVGRQDDNQMPTRIGDGEFTSVRDYVRENGCGPEAMKKLAALQKASKSSELQSSSGLSRTPIRIKRSPMDSSRSRAWSPSNRSRSPERRRSPEMPSISKSCQLVDRSRSPSVSPPRHAPSRSPPRNSRRQKDISPPRNRRAYRSPVSPPRPGSHSRHFRDGHSRRSRDYKR
nr:RNA binding motif protein 2 [Hymenolepis microstoma]